MVICLTKYLLHDKYHLTKIWLAAHWEKKIKKTQIFEVDIEKSIQEIMSAEIILDLRISGHLLVGIVKIHSRKTKYLLNECNSIFYQVKIFHARKIDLPDNKLTAPMTDITLDQFFSDFIENDIMDTCFSNQSNLEDITLKETNERLTLIDDADIEDFTFCEVDEPFDDFDENSTRLHENLEKSDYLNSVIKKKIAVKEKVKKASYLNVPDEGNNFNAGDDFDLDIFNLENREIEDLERTEIPESTEIPGRIEIQENIEIRRSIKVSVAYVNVNANHYEENNFDISSVGKKHNIEKLHLEPVMISTENISKHTKSRKRRLSVDHIKCIPYETIKKQVLDTSDITCTLEIAPSSRRQMTLKQIGCAEQLFCLPAIHLQNARLLKIFQCNLKTRQSDSFEMLPEEESFDMPRKKSKRNSHKELAINGNLSEIFNADNSDGENNVENNMSEFDNNFLDGIEQPELDNNFMDGTEQPELDNNSMNNTEFENIAYNPILEKGILDHLSLETIHKNNGMSSDNSAQTNPVSKSSEEKWRYAFHNRLIQMMQSLKLLFQSKSVISFSFLAQNHKKLSVARKFLCLLMLKKFQVICLEQSGSFKEIFISPGVNFEAIYLKFCN